MKDIEISLIVYIELQAHKLWKNSIYGTQTGMFHAIVLIEKIHSTWFISSFNIIVLQKCATIENVYNLPIHSWGHWDLHISRN